MQENQKEEIDKSEKQNLKLIIIDDIEYNYNITKMDIIDGISIIFNENKPDKNITFKYEATLDKLVSDIKHLKSLDTIDEMIAFLQNIFLNNQIEIEKREQRYFLKLKIELSMLGKIKQYEIELIKQEPINEKKNYY